MTLPRPLLSTRRLLAVAVALAVSCSVGAFSRPVAAQPADLWYTATGNTDCTITFRFSNPTNAYWAARAHVGVPVTGPLASGYANGVPSGDPPYFGTTGVTPPVPFRQGLEPRLTTVTIPLLGSFHTQDSYDLVTSIDGGPITAWRAEMGTHQVTVSGCLPPPVTDPPVTQPPVTQPPVTQPPVTQPPRTDPPVTEPPVTAGPVTPPTATEAPSTSVTSTTVELDSGAVTTATSGRGRTGGTLPATGSSTGAPVFPALLLVGAGLAAIVVTRRRGSTDADPAVE